MSYPANTQKWPCISRLKTLSALIPGVPSRHTDIFATLLAIAGLFFYSGSLVEVLTPDGAQSAPLVQALGLGLGLISGTNFLLRRGTTARQFHYFLPALAPIAFVVASMLWSIEPMLSARRIFGLLCSTAFALWLYERFPGRDLFSMISGATLLLVMVNVTVSLAIPAIGVHPPLDKFGDPSPHVGAWRGLFYHKNDFGRLMAISTVILWIAHFRQKSWRRMTGTGLLVGYLGVVGSSSGQAAFLSVTIPMLVWALKILRPLSPDRRAMVIAVAVPTVIIISLFSQIVIAVVLELLGKDPSLTGRTEIWLGTLQAIQGNMLLGGGYGAGWDLVAERLFVLTGISVGHAHNGYLDLITDLGLLGLLITTLFYITILFMAIHAYLFDLANETALLAVGISAFTLIGNWVASFLILHNSIYWVLPVLSIMSLRHAYTVNRLPQVIAWASAAPAAPSWSHAAFHPLRPCSHRSMQIEASK